MKDIVEKQHPMRLFLSSGRSFDQVLVQMFLGVETWGRKGSSKVNSGMNELVGVESNLFRGKFQMMLIFFSHVIAYVSVPFMVIVSIPR